MIHINSKKVMGGLYEIGAFIIDSFHIFLILLILVGWAILPKKYLPWLLTLMIGIPALWVVMGGECILTKLSHAMNSNSISEKFESNTGDKKMKGFVKSLLNNLGVEINNTLLSGIMLGILGTAGYLTTLKLYS